jgi:hypothetical protein
MRRLRSIVFWLLFFSPVIYSLARLTVMNPAWMIGIRFPQSRLQLQTVNSPDLHFWSAIAGLCGIPMTDPDHSLTVYIDHHSEPLRLNGLEDADEVHVTNSRVVDISAFSRSDSRLSGVVFVGCDLSGLPPEQRAFIRPYSDQIADSFCISYDAKPKR